CGGRVQERVAAIFQLAAESDGGANPFERRLLWVALDSRRLLSVSACGAATALCAGTTTRVQSDVKSSLAYASLTQVGLIVVEISIGWYTIAFVHLAGHARFWLLLFSGAPN